MKRRIARVADQLWSRPWSGPAIAAALSLVVVTKETWPLVLHLGSYGIGYPGDGLGGSAVWQGMVNEHLNPFSPGRISDFNAPAGLPVTWQIDIQQWPTTILMYFFTWLSGGNGEFAFTIYVVIGIGLTAASMAWLAEHLTKDRVVGVIIGVGLTLAPFMEIAREGHPAFVHDWTIAATVGAVWVLYERPAPRRAVAVGALGFVAMSWSGYQLLLVAFSMLVVMAGFMLAAMRTPDRLRHLRNFAIVGSVMLGGVVVQYAAILLIGHGANPANAVRHFGRSALTVYGARWYEYVVPDSRSVIFGGTTKSFFATHLHGSNPAETTLYLGLSIGVPVVCGFVAYWRGKLQSAARLPFIVCGVALFLAALWASLPLDAGAGGLGIGARLPTLAAFIDHFTSNWRVFSRFVLVALVAWFLLGAVGLAWLSRGGAIRRWAALVIAAIALFVDLYIPRGSFPLRAPQIAAAIHRLPAGVIAQYPFVRGEIDGYAPLFNQAYYGHPVLNGYDDQPQEAFERGLGDLSNPSTVRDLGLLNVRYVLDVNQQLARAPYPMHPSPLLRPVVSGTYGPWPATVFEVPAIHTDAAIVMPQAGFSLSEFSGPNHWQWLMRDQGTINFVAHCPGPCRGQLRFNIAALGPGRDVTLEAQDGLLLAHLHVSAARAVNVPVDLRQTTSITVRATPGPLPISRVIAGRTDERSVSVQLIDLRWVGG